MYIKNKNDSFSNIISFILICSILILISIILSFIFAIPESKNSDKDITENQAETESYLEYKGCTNVDDAKKVYIYYDHHDRKVVYIAHNYSNNNTAIAVTDMNH